MSNRDFEIMQMAEDLLLNSRNISMDETNQEISSSIYPFIKRNTYTKKQDMMPVLLENQSLNK
jgi:hypothetical protein